MNFGKLAALLASAAALVAAEFALFGNLLARLAPPVYEINVKVGVACFFSLFVLLAISLLARKKSDWMPTILAGISTVFFVSGIGLYFWYEDMQSDYVYRFPVETERSEESPRYIRGEIHAEGKKLIGTQSLPAAIANWGGIDFVTGEQLFWSEKTQHNVELKLIALYLGLSVSFGAAIFPLIILALEGGKKSPKAKKKTQT